jgi:hypothetical protein
VKDVEELPKGRNVTIYFEANLIRGIENASRELGMADKDVVKIAVKQFLKERNYMRKKEAEY